MLSPAAEEKPIEPGHGGGVGGAQSSASPRRLLFVVTSLGWGGAESQVIDLATNFYTRGWEVAVASLLDQAERRDTLEAERIPVHTLGMKRGVPDPRAIARLGRLVKTFEPTVVHAHMVHANLLTRITRLFAPVPVLISSAHNVNEEGRWREIAYRLTDFLSDITTNVSHVAVQRSIAVGAAPRHRIRFMPNGIDLNRFRRDLKVRTSVRQKLKLGEQFAWLAVGRFEEQKDYPNLIEAFAQVAGHQTRPALLIVGEGPLREEVEARVHEIGLADSVYFLGRREDVPDLMNAADAFVMSSAWEGLPIVLLEAAASGLSIVATDVGGNAQIVRHGETGELVPAGDSSALGQAMIRTMDMSTGSRMERGNAGAGHVRATFGLDSVVEQWEKLYRSLLATKEARLATKEAKVEI